MSYENIKKFPQSTQMWNSMNDWASIKYITVFVGSPGASHHFMAASCEKNGIYHMFSQFIY